MHEDDYGSADRRARRLLVSSKRSNRGHVASCKLKLGKGECPHCYGDGFILQRTGGGGPSADDYWYDEIPMPCRTCKGEGTVITFTRVKK